MRSPLSVMPRQLGEMNAPLSAAASDLSHMEAESAAVAASATEAARAYAAIGKARIPAPRALPVAAPGGFGGGGRGGGRGGEPDEHHHHFRGPEIGGVPGLFGGAMPGGLGDVAFKGLIALMIADTARRGVMGFLGEGGRVSDVQAALAQQGVSPAGIAKATAAAQHAAVTIPGATPSEALAAFMEARAVLGKSSEALALMPTLLKDTMALTGRGLGGDADLLKLLKALDVQGALKGPNGKLSPDKAASALHAAIAAMITSQGLLTPAMLLRFVQMAGPGIQNSNFKDLLRGYTELLIGIGNRTGRGTGMAFLKLLGGQLTTSQLRAFEGLGLIPKSAVHGSKGHPNFAPDSLKGAAILRNQGLVAWEEQVLFPAIEKKYGKLDINTVERGIAQFPVSAQRVLVGIFTMGPQVKRFGGPGGLFDQALKTNLLTSLMGKSWSANVKNFDSAFTTLIQTLSAPAIPQAISTMRALADAMRWLAKAIPSIHGLLNNPKSDELRKLLQEHRVVIPHFAPLPVPSGGTRAPAPPHLNGPMPQSALLPPVSMIPPMPHAAGAHNESFLIGRSSAPSNLSVTVNAPVTVNAGPGANPDEIGSQVRAALDEHTQHVIRAIQAQRASDRRGSMIDRTDAGTPWQGAEAI